MISIIIPAYNESSNILETINEIEKSDLEKFEYEIIVVDDHSEDDIQKVISTLNDPRVSIIRLSRRSGSHIALRAGLLHSTGDAAICIAADGQDNSAAIGEMLRKWTEGAHIVWALRSRRDEPFMAKFVNALFYKVLELLTEKDPNKIDLARADFYLLDRKVVNSVNQCMERNSSLFGLIVWLGYRQDYVEYDRKKRRGGKSKWGFRSKLRLALDWIIAFSGLPLKLISIVGIVIAAMGGAYAAFVFVYAALGYATPGWAEAVIITLVSSGVQMVMLGVIGEYLWRTLDETRKRPLFFIEEKHSSREKVKRDLKLKSGGER